MSIKNWLIKKYVNHQIKKGVDTFMKEAWKFIDKWLAHLPFNGQKTNIGDLVTLLSIAALIVEKFIPGLEELAKHLPPEQAAIITALVGIIVGALGRFHQMAKFFKTK